MMQLFNSEYFLRYRRIIQITYLSLLLLVPLVIGIVWGDYFTDDVFITFRYAQNLAAGRGLLESVSARVQAPFLHSPLSLILLLLPARLGWPLPQTAFVLNVLGWTATAVTLLLIGYSICKPIAALVAATLLVFNPILVSGLGIAESWFPALVLGAVSAAQRRRWGLQTLLLLLLLLIYWHISTLVLVILFVTAQAIKERRFPIGSATAVALIALGLGTLSNVLFSTPLTWSVGRAADWYNDIGTLFAESEFYWLFLPPLSIGFFSIIQRYWQMRSFRWLLFGMMILLGSHPAARGVTAVAILILVGIGLEQIIEWLQQHEMTSLSYNALVIGVILIAGLPLGLAQASSLRRRYQARPTAQAQLEEQVAAWVHANSEPTATLFASPRLGYLAKRPLLTAPEETYHSTFSLETLLRKERPDLLVSLRTVVWDALVQQSWFQLFYEPLVQFNSPRFAAAPVTVWGRRHFTDLRVEPEPLRVHIPGKIDVLGFQRWPARIYPGEEIDVTLFLRASPGRSVAPFQTELSLISVADTAVTQAQQNFMTPRSMLPNQWQAGQIIEEPFVLTVPADMQPGAYYLNVSFHDQEASEPWVSIQNNDLRLVFSRVELETVVIPWRGDLSGSQLENANFDNQIELTAFAITEPDGQSFLSTAVSPGTSLNVALYWQARQLPADDYTVFVHLLDADGQLITSHDSQPMLGRLPTGLWVPEETVLDNHPLSLPPELPAGTYTLQIGLYQPESGLRLPVWDADGVAQPDGVLFLQSILIDRAE